MWQFVSSVLLPIFFGTVVISFMAIMKRYTFKRTAISPLQFLIIAYGSATLLFALVYLALWGFHIPTVLPGFWRAVLGGTMANFIIQFLNAKASSMDKGEVSLTAPLQAMTPGLITGLAIILGEYPGKLGVGGIFLMIVGSYVLLWPTTPKRWYEYFGPLSRLLLILRWKHLPEDERNKAKVVALALGSATMGTVGLLFDGLCMRRGLGMQGLILASMTLTGGLSASYAIWYALQPDSKPEQRLSGLLQGNILKYTLVFAGLWVLQVLLIHPSFNHTLVAYTGTLKRLHILWSVLLGYWLFREEEFKKRLWAAVFIVAGAVLISMDGVVGAVSDKLQGFGL